MNVTETSLPGVLLIEPRIFRDDRGYFLETWSDAAFGPKGLPTTFLQDNLSYSAVGVLRGLHYQFPTAQGKLVSVARGEVFDVAVDIRVGSPTFGKWVGATLTAANGHQLWIPEGFAHGFVVIGSEPASFAYKCTAGYDPAGAVLGPLGRPRHRDRVARRRAAPVAEGPRRPAAPRHPRRPAPPLPARLIAPPPPQPGAADRTDAPMAPSIAGLVQFLDLAFALTLAPWFALMALIVAAALAGRFGGRRRQESGPAPAKSRFLVVIPAHDEEGVIAVTVRSCLALDYDPALFQVVAIADNCTDGTAAAATAAGAHVEVRVDPARKSKGFALEDFFRATGSNPAIRPFDAYVLVDADTSVAPDLLRAFDRSLRRGDDFIQGYYTVRNADASWRTRLMTWAFSLANGVWPAGLDRLGLGVGLKGNGMCFRAAALERFPWRAHGLVEDMEFAWHLRVAGERVRFQPEARVFGEMVSRGGSGAASQRQRWEEGRRGLKSSFRRPLRASPRLTRWQKLVLQVDLDFPPLGSLVPRLALASLAAAVAIRWDRGSPAAASLVGLLGIEWAILAAYLASPVVVVGLPARYLLSGLNVPYYLLWKVSVSLMKKPAGWVRTPREVATTPRKEQ